MIVNVCGGRFYLKAQCHRPGVFDCFRFLSSLVAIDLSDYGDEQLQRDVILTMKIEEITSPCKRSHGLKSTFSLKRVESCFISSSQRDC